LSTDTGVLVKLFSKDRGGLSQREFAANILNGFKMRQVMCQCRHAMGKTDASKKCYFITKLT